nr:hypothetical protein [Tanacetum cinerariifolium]
STQPPLEQMDEGFTAMAYPKVHENLKLTVEEQVLLEEPASSSGTLSSLQHLTKDLSFGQLFFSDKPSEADNDKANAETEAESMVSVTIQQDIHGARLYTLEQLDIPHQVSKPVDEVVTNAVDWAMQAPLYNHFRDLPEADIKEIFHQRMWETDSYKTHKDHMQLYEALEKSMNHDHTEELTKDLAEARKKKKKSCGSGDLEGSTGTDLQIHLALASNYSPPPEDLLFTQTGDIAMFMDWFCKRRGITKLKPQDLEGPSFEIIKFFHPNVIHLQYQMEECHKLLIDSVYDSILRHNVSKPLPLGGPPSQVTIQSDFFFNKDLEYLRYGSKGSRLALSISKTKAAYYPDVGLEQMVPDQMWIEEECKYDIDAIRGITKLKPQDLEGPSFEIIKVFHPNVIHLQYQMEECHKLLIDSVYDSILRHNVSKPLPLGGPPSQVTIQSDFFFNKDLEYLRYGSKGSRLALSISKTKAAYYPDVGLEQMVPDQMWIEEECKYDIDAIVVRTHMRILGVVRIEFFSMYGYDYMKKIVLRRMDLNEHVIAERDFKYLY